MFKKAMLFVANHKLATVALFLPFGVIISAAILAYQERRKPYVGPVRDTAADEPVTPPSLKEFENMPNPRAWH